MTEIEKLYDEIPPSFCDANCSKCCTNMIQFAPSEEAAIGGYDYKGVCPHLKDGKCSVYTKRPFICRLYGTSEMFVCEGCTPERYLTDEETATLVHRYVALKNAEERKH